MITSFKLNDSSELITGIKRIVIEDCELTDDLSSSRIIRVTCKNSTAREILREAARVKDFFQPNKPVLFLTTPSGTFFTYVKKASHTTSFEPGYSDPATESELEIEVSPYFLKTNSSSSTFAFPSSSFEKISFRASAPSGSASIFYFLSTSSSMTSSGSSGTQFTFTESIGEYLFTDSYKVFGIAAKITTGAASPTITTTIGGIRKRVITLPANATVAVSLGVSNSAEISSDSSVSVSITSTQTITLDAHAVYYPPYFFSYYSDSGGVYLDVLANEIFRAVFIDGVPFLVPAKRTSAYLNVITGFSGTATPTFTFYDATLVP